MVIIFCDKIYNARILRLVWRDVVFISVECAAITVAYNDVLLVHLVIERNLCWAAYLKTIFMVTMSWMVGTMKGMVGTMP